MHPAYVSGEAVRYVARYQKRVAKAVLASVVA